MASSSAVAITFSDAAVKALLDGSKSTDRRVIRDQPLKGADWQPVATGRGFEWMSRGGNGQRGAFSLGRCPYGHPGSLLWVREAWHWAPRTDTSDRSWRGSDPRNVFYRATDASALDRLGLKWRSAQNMPRWASRLTLEVREVRVERLSDIPDAERFVEGGIGKEVVQPQLQPGFQERRKAGTVRAWTDNPLLWVLSFQVIQQNVDAVLGERAARDARGG